MLLCIEGLPRNKPYSLFSLNVVGPISNTDGEDEGGKDNNSVIHFIILWLSSLKNNIECIREVNDRRSS